VFREMATKRFVKKFRLAFLAIFFALALTSIVVLLPGSKTQQSACAADARLKCNPITPPIGQVAVDIARSQLGYKYVWGGCHTGYPIPSKNLSDNCGGAGFDCSGLAIWSWYMAGIRVNGQPITIKQSGGYDSTTASMWAGRSNYYFKVGKNLCSS